MTRRLALFAVLLLGACGTPSSVVREETGRCEYADAEQCVVLACDGGECGLFDCEDVDSEGPEVELARGYRTPQRPPAFRNWRNMGIRPGARPRMTFHFRYREGFLPALPREPGKLVHHHLFPQQPVLANWFRRNGVDIHKFTILIPEHIHRQIHSGTGRGGMWNQAWRDYRESVRNLPRDTGRTPSQGGRVHLPFRVDGPRRPLQHACGPL